MPRVEVPNMGGWIKPALSPATYQARIKHAEPKTSRKGTNGVFMVFEVVDGPEQTWVDSQGNDHSEDAAGREFILTFWLPHSGMSKRGQEMMGERIEQLATAADVSIQDEGFDTEDLIGKEIMISIGNEKNDQTGEVREEFKSARPV